LLLHEVRHAFLVVAIGLDPLGQLLLAHFLLLIDVLYMPSYKCQ
jgi:hypothetical protein